MAKLGINTGSIANDGTGDTLLTAGLKINSNFNEIYTKFGDGTNLSGIVTYSNLSTFAFSSGIATNANIASYASLAGVATYASFSGLGTYASSAGVATYASSSGVASVSNYSVVSGVATYSSSAGVATYSSLAGVATYASSAGVATYASSAGISTTSQGLTGSPDISVGILTATGGNYTGVVTGTSANFSGIVTASTVRSSQFIRTNGTSGQFLKADGSIDSSIYLTSYTETSGLNQVLARGNQSPTGISVGVVTSTSFVITGGTSSQFLKANGTLDSSTYLTTTGSGSRLTGIVTSVTAGNGISLSASTGSITISAIAGEVNPWSSNSFGISTSSSVGIGSTQPTSKLTVNGSALFTGIVTARNSATQDSISLNGRAGGTSSFNLSLTPTTLAASRIVTFQDVDGTVYVSGGADVSLADGGTNASLTASNGGIVYSTATSMAILSGTATAGQMLRSGASGAPSWSTATFPSTATNTGRILRADGTNWVETTATYPATTTLNQILYSSSANTIAGIPTALTAVLVSDSTGVPLFTSGSTGNRLLRTNGTAISFAQANLTSDVTGTLPIANGGTNSTATPTNGGIAYGNGTAYAFSAAGSSGQVLISGGAASPTWSSNLSVTGTKVGVNSTSPTSDLDVGGDVKVIGVITATTLSGQLNAGISTIAVNTSIPALRINQSGTGNSLVVEDSANPDITPFIVNTNGKVGVGTISVGNADIAVVRPTGNASISIGQNVDGTGVNHLGLWYGSGAGNIFTSTGGLTFNVDGGNTNTTATFRFQRNFTTTYMTISSSGTNIAGALSKTSGTFKIDHPLPELENTHHLVHSFIEGPRADLIYRGKCKLSQGSGTVNIDEYVGMTTGTWSALCREPQLFLQNNEDWTQVKGEVSADGTITITAKTSTSTATIDWMVVSERKDKHMYDTGWTDDNGKPILEPLK